MKRTLKYLLPLTALALALFLCPAVSAAEPALDIERCEAMEDGTVIYYTGEPYAELMADEARDSNLPQLSAPTDLEWGKYYPFSANTTEGGAQDTTSREVPGMASWAQGAVNEDLKDLTQIRFLIQYYKIDPSGDKLITQVPVTCTKIREGFISTNEAFLLDVRETGDYYFTVRALGDGKTCRDSEAVKSETWHFEDPGVRLSAPSEAPVWAAAPNADGDPVVSFVRSDDPLVLIHRIRYYYTSGPNEKTERPGTALIYNNASSYKLSADMRSRFGAGYYGASLRYLSGDITKIQCSEESKASSPLYISKFYGKTLDEIMSLVSKDSSKKDIQDALDAVRKMNAGKLAASMLADQDNTDAAGQIRTLEELAGVTSAVDVSASLSEVFDKTKVEMIGAGLNADPGQTVILRIDEPAGEDFDIPAMYDSAVPFSIRLVDEKDNELPLQGGALAVPVKLTLPIPEKSFVLMQRYADGTYAEISKGSDGTSATFMLRSSGSYVLAKRTEILVRQKPGEGIQVNMKSNPGGRSLTAALAVFDADGKLIGVSLTSINDESSTINTLVRCNPDNARLLRVMILDGYVPAERARSIRIG